MPLKEEEYGDLLENLMVNNTDVIYFKDLQSRFIKINEACAHKHGFLSADEIVGKTDFDLWSEEHARQAFEREQRIIATGIPQNSFEEREVWPDGRITWVSSTKMPLRDGEGNIIGTFGVSRDITLRKEAELRIRQYAEDLKNMTDELEEDVRMAGKLQKSFFTGGYPIFTNENGNCIEFMHRFVLNRQITGDYCAFFRISDTQAGIFICDINGSGIRAALGTALIRGLIQELSICADDPGKFLQRMNNLLRPLLTVEELSLGATACYMAVDLKSGLVRLANAGHPMPIYFRQEYSASWFSEENGIIGKPLALEPDVEYPVVERSIEPGDTVIAFTDGLYTVRNRMDDEYGLKRLLDSAHSWAGEPLEDVFDGLEGDVHAFAGTGKYTDDVCLIGFKLKQLLD
ncbi:SpoIIE family protein phosphatase [Pontiella agarivorans]|uniref:SpoIIE family protein phosphatase n=1 Tax=Pontiella agarivorans TaxID=3038953 RepID=A0ABU5MVW2_9BACT|nr:SpoIIE family protein phosphatase [Pontiella agarivorans]MDZ8118091.1 SpoIIE family protein phosphatase [Pontiella agarivorans]